MFEEKENKILNLVVKFNFRERNLYELELIGYLI